jgi:uncharacterized protein YsxB (DUF464 family)
MWIWANLKQGALAPCSKVLHYHYYHSHMNMYLLFTIHRLQQVQIRSTGAIIQGIALSLLSLTHEYVSAIYYSQTTISSNRSTSAIIQGIALSLLSLTHEYVSAIYYSQTTTSANEEHQRHNPRYCITIIIIHTWICIYYLLFTNNNKFKLGAPAP